METPSLGQAVAQVLRAELAARRINGPTFAAMVGQSKANAWRKVEGHVKITFDDLDLYAAALGLDVDDVIARAVLTQKQGRVYQPADPAEAELASELGSAARDVVAQQSERLRRGRRRPAEDERRDASGQ